MLLQREKKNNMPQFDPKLETFDVFLDNLIEWILEQQKQ